MSKWTTQNSQMCNSLNGLDIELKKKYILLFLIFQIPTSYKSIDTSNKVELLEIYNTT